MYVAKQTGRNRFQQFDVSQDRQMESARQTIERVRQALLHDELCLFYQPKVNLRTGEVIGFEALLRWQHPQDGLVPPLSFLPQVEQSDVIIEIGEWVIDQVLTQLAQWRAQGQTWPVSVNLAARHFQSHGFMSRLQAVLARHSTVPPGMLEFEILESVALADVTAMNELMAHCQALGISFSLDDFGTGYSSLSYLKHLPAHTLKIDQSFVRNMRDDHNDLALVGAIVNIAQLFDRRVIAEGVETVEQGVQLLRMGCDLAQGYGIARPMPPNEVLGWVAQYQTNSQWQLEGSNSAAASA
jgi:EAL domain-containing protein (putative c-di-GMP-specific phosphodiesterase class I)